MAVTPASRRLAWLVPVMLLVAVVVAVLVVVRDPAERSAGTPTPSPSSAPTQADPDTWCAAFRTFAEAQAVAVGTPDDPAAQQALRDTAEALLDLGRPLGLSEGGQASMVELVQGALGQAPAPDATPDPEARDAYLAASCPA